MSRPTTSAGIFYKGYERGKGQGKAPAERSMQTVVPPKATPMTAIGRMIYPAQNPLTERSMRFPLEGSAKD